MTAPVWIRGILDEHYGVPVDSVTYHTGGEEEPGRIEKQKLDLPANIKVTPIPEDKTLAQMLAAGEIDALHTARAPSTFDGKKRGAAVPELRRGGEGLLQEDRSIFPIMHTIVIRRDLYEKNRWIAQTLMKAFVKAQHLAYERQRQTAAHMAMLPWHNAHVEEARELMGDDFWPYGFEPNHATLDDVPEVPPRLRALEAAAEARGAVRARSAGGVQDLRARVDSRSRWKLTRFHLNRSDSSQIQPMSLIASHIRRVARSVITTLKPMRNQSSRRRARVRSPYQLPSTPEAIIAAISGT